MAKQNDQLSGWTGWVFFGGFMMIILGIFQTIAGLTGLLKHSYYAVTTTQGLLVFNYQAWGWVELVLGIVILLAGFSLLHGSTWARIVGVILAALSAVANLVTVKEYPVWSIVLLAIDVIVIYAITVYGGQLKQD
ncbi:MAG TPA: hypothetical protein VL989_02000 [Candidatus Sulfotelmatobacter sp.]|nr:hypothetical protein [Candidatus Sulfotelmatobacter sp.]